MCISYDSSVLSYSCIPLLCNSSKQTCRGNGKVGLIASVGSALLK